VINFAHGDMMVWGMYLAWLGAPRPSLGLAPVVVASIFDNLARVNREGTTVLLVEQNVLRALRLCHRAYALENRRIALTGPRDHLLADEGIKRAYLGR
jgi:branched-chain amino acid transport system ATP-binding protein